ncbi:MAG TPA: hypothetical protein VE842_17005 [Pyrinomonadaceae bacterium]|nr:hypothetical protein [Pyrinomonadaceae bacterium]
MPRPSLDQDGIRKRERATGAIRDRRNPISLAARGVRFDWWARRRLMLKATV